MKRGGHVYILSDNSNKALYVGVTSNLHKRIFQHKSKFYPKSYTARYNINKLVYFERFSSIVEAIAREKQLKAGSRKKKLDLINAFNTDWKDLFEANF